MGTVSSIDLSKCGIHEAHEEMGSGCCKGGTRCWVKQKNGRGPHDQECADGELVKASQMKKHDKRYVVDVKCDKTEIRMAEKNEPGTTKCIPCWGICLNELSFGSGGGHAGCLGDERLSTRASEFKKSIWLCMPNDGTLYTPSTEDKQRQRGFVKTGS